jgi:NADH:ubiquinone oxidoreductase subunit F (NADH-binding)
VNGTLGSLPDGVIPHLLIEGMIVSSYARSKLHLSVARYDWVNDILEAAIAEAKAKRMARR